jgi:hypothetical protein
LHAFAFICGNLPAAKNKILTELEQRRCSVRQRWSGLKTDALLVSSPPTFDI